MTIISLVHGGAQLAASAGMALADVRAEPEGPWLIGWTDKRMAVEIRDKHGPRWRMPVEMVKLPHRARAITVKCLAPAGADVVTGLVTMDLAMTARFAVVRTKERQTIYIYQFAWRHPGLPWVDGVRGKGVEEIKGRDDISGMMGPGV